MSQGGSNKEIDSQNVVLVGCSSKSIPISSVCSSHVVGTGTSSSSDNAQSSDAGCKIDGSLSSKATCISEETTLGVEIITLVETSAVSPTFTLGSSTVRSTCGFVLVVIGGQRF